MLPTWEKTPLAAIRPSGVQAWLKGVSSKLAPSTVNQVLINFSTILSAAVEDGLIAKNPCKSKAVSKPVVPRRRVTPWPLAQVRAVINAHPERYQGVPATGAGAALRQGEIFGIGVDELDFLRKSIHVVRQVKYVRNQLCFTLPKYGKTRDVPMSDGLALVLAEHIRRFPPIEVTLPWGDPDAENVQLVTVRLVFTTRERRALNRNYINSHIWKPALAEAGVPPTRGNGMHALRHYCASNWLEQGVSIKAVAEYLGHSDEAFTLRTYTHLMPTADDKARAAADTIFADDGECGADSAEDAQVG